MLSALTGALCGFGLYFVLADLCAIPYYKTSQAVVSLSKRQKEKTTGLDLWLRGLAEWLAKHLRMNEFRRAQLQADLRSAQLSLTPEQYQANAIVKALLVGIFAIPTLFLFPVLCPVTLFLAVFLYNRESKAISRRLNEKRQNIEYELPRLVFTIEKTLKHSRDVLYMLDSYSRGAGAELKQELAITTADMRSGNYESAITRLETRVGSPLMSDVCRGLISILRGDDTALYWTSLAMKCNELQRQQLRMQAQKVPRKIRRLSLCLLVCFMLIYVVVIVEQIMTSIGVLF